MDWRALQRWAEERPRSSVVPEHVRENQASGVVEGGGCVGVRDGDPAGVPILQRYLMAY